MIAHLKGNKESGSTTILYVVYNIQYTDFILKQDDRMIARVNSMMMVVLMIVMMIVMVVVVMMMFDDVDDHGDGDDHGDPLGGPPSQRSGEFAPWRSAAPLDPKGTNPSWR